MHFSALAALTGLISVVSAGPAVPADLDFHTRSFKHNDFSCKPSAKHPNPVVLLHGLGATYYEDLNFLETFLQSKGICTFSLTYGAYDGFPLVGGLRPLDYSAGQISDLIKEVHQKTGASKVDIVGHSEGAFLSMYVPKFSPGISEIVDNIVAIAPPTHGTDFAGLIKLAPVLGPDGRKKLGEALEKVGCAPCDEITTGGSGIEKLNNGPIVQAGNNLTVIMSKYDELVTPVTTAFVHEDGVHNIYVQDYCPFDPVGHIGEAYDANVWNLVLNSLENQIGREFFCLVGSPGK